MFTVKGKLTWIELQPRSFYDHPEWHPFPLGWAEMAGRSFPQTPSEQLLLFRRRLLVVTFITTTYHEMLLLNDGRNAIIEMQWLQETDVSSLPLPMMTKGLCAAFKTATALVMALWSAKLSGGAGQQDTTLQRKQSSFNVYSTGITKVMSHWKKNKQTWFCSYPLSHLPCPRQYQYNKHPGARICLSELPASKHNQITLELTNQLYKR